ncbi:MAG TPA: fibronectin type III domain-containing protein, partial [Verrucomicrobiae bacterium]|nr:fibronectin type III domain-containing protein [Verrucomicrobiae bacterium]
MDSRFGSPICSRLIALWLGGLMFAFQCWCNAQDAMVTWSPSASPGVIGYNVFYGLSGSTSTNEIWAGNTASITISNLVVGDTYFFAAAAVNSSGIQSPVSGTINYLVPVPTPSLSITNITGGMRVTNSMFTVMGNATDTVGVANVFYSLNGAPYVTASINGAQWNAILILAPGNNTLSAYAINNDGGISATDTVAFIYAPVAPLTVQTNGEG